MGIGCDAALTMKSIAVTSIIFGLIFGAALAGMARPTHDPLGPEAKEVVRLTTGLITTMTGLVLGILVSSAKSIYDAGKDEVANVSMQIVLIDRSLAGYGPETAEIRSQFRQLVEVGIERIWPRYGSLLSDLSLVLRKQSDHSIKQVWLRQV